MQFWNHKTIQAPLGEIDKHTQAAGKDGWEPYAAVPLSGQIVVLLRQELATNPNVGTVTIQTKKHRGAYIPGMPRGSEE